MVEVFTIGGGEYIVNTFNAVAAWTGGGGYRSLVKVVMVIGLIYALLSVAFTMNIRVWLNWFLGSTLIYMCLMVPTVDVKVTDRINPSLAPATVANVPLGLGVIASFTSQLGDWLTRTAETVFLMPSELNYSTNGMIYGARLFDATRNFQIRDAEFATNLQAHYKNCVFGDILLNHKSLTDLAEATDLWTAIGPGSGARAQPWLEKSGGTVTSYIITCRAAYLNLTNQWGQVIDADTPLWGRQSFPKLTNAAAAQKLRQDVPIVNAAFTGANSDYVTVMRQNTAINAFMQARDAMSGSAGGASIDAFATTRADIQARNTYNSIAQQAMSWVPILNIVLTVVFYAMFPVIFPLFLMPQTGIAALKGYVTGFFYLAAWGPLYVILHMICMTRATTAANGVAEGGASLANFAGIGAVNAETATIAGFMLMSVPFIAGGLARGAMGISGQATSILAPAQNAAEAAALEQTTGNYSYGNTSFANSTSNMRQTGQWSDAPSYSTGAAGFTTRFDNGATESSFGNGSIITDTTGAISRLPFSATLNTGYVSEMRQQLSAVQREARSLEESQGHSFTASHTDRSVRGRSTEFTSGSEAGSGSQSGTSLESFDRNTGSDYNGLDHRSGVSESLRITDGASRSTEKLHTVRGGFEAGMGGRRAPKSSGNDTVAGLPGNESGAGTGGEKKGGRLGGIARSLPGIEGSVTWTGQQSNRLSHGTDRSVSSDDASNSTDGMRNEHANGQSAGVSDSTYSRGGVFSRSSSSSMSSVSNEDALTDAYSREDRLRHLRERAQQLSNDISYAETHNMQMSENLSQELADWYRREAADNPGLNAPSLHEVSFTPQQRQVRDQMIAKFLEVRRREIWSEVGSTLSESTLRNIDPPRDIDSEESVRGRYHPQGLATAPTVGAPGDGSTTIARVQSGKADLEAAAEVKQTMRAGFVSKAADVQSTVNLELGKGFFDDPKLRE